MNVQFLTPKNSKGLTLEAIQEYNVAAMMVNFPTLYAGTAQSDKDNLRYFAQKSLERVKEKHNLNKVLTNS
jgi:hypothetical protein